MEDNRLRALDDGNVFALGECAQLRDRVHGSEAAIVAQARVNAFPALSLAFESNTRLSEPELTELLAPPPTTAKHWPRVA